jgi:hypothetical protein
MAKVSTKFIVILVASMALCTMIPVTNGMHPHHQLHHGGPHQHNAGVGLVNSNLESDSCGATSKSACESLTGCCWYENSSINCEPC